MKKKWVITFIIMIVTFIHCVAQIPYTVNELKKYLSDNVISLMPFEGIYSVTVNSYNVSTKKWNVFHHQWGMIYTEADGKYHEYRFEDDNTLTEMRSYRYDPDTQILSHYNGSHPNKVTNSNHFVKKQDESRSVGFYYEMEYTKVYPTDDMYAEAALEKEILGAANLIDNGYYSSAIAILDGVLKTKQSPREYYYRASAYYCLKEFYAAIQDCNRALSYDLNSENASAIYYLRGLCYFLINDKESGISDMKNAGEDGIKFLDENGFNETASKPQRNNNKMTKTTTTQRRNNVPALKKTK